jgi:hypothetical protein
MQWRAPPPVVAYCDDGQNLFEREILTNKQKKRIVFENKFKTLDFTRHRAQSCHMFP